MSIVHERRSDLVHGADDNVGLDAEHVSESGHGSGSGADKPKAVEQPHSSSWKALGAGWAGDPENDARPALGLYAHSFFSEEMSACRRAYLKLVVRATILTIILTWTCLPIYWGSLSASAELTGNLEAWIINRDQAQIGNSLENAVLASADPLSGHSSLWWRILNASKVGDDEAVAQAVINEQAWLAIVVSTNATARLTQARETGDVTYNPSSAITVYYAQARNEVAAGNYLLPITTALLSNFTSTYAASSAQRYLAAIVSQDGSVNLTALNSIAQAPKTICPGVGYTMVNLRPYTDPIAQAVLLVGQIYICIFAFIFVMAHSSARLYVETYLTFSSYLFIRIAMPLLFYIPLSLSYAMISLPFKLPFGARYSYGTGFFAFFAFIYLGMCALGLALEAMVTLTTPKFVPFFLVLLIIVNISTVAIPPELQPQLYTYGAGFQFWNIQQATRTIIFNTYSHLPTNAAVLIAWVLLSCGSLSVFTWLVRAYDVRKMHRAARVGAESGVGSRCASQSYDARRVYTTKSKDAWETGGAGQEKSKGEMGDLDINEDGEETGKGCASAAVDVVTLKA